MRSIFPVMQPLACSVLPSIVVAETAPRFAMEPSGLEPSGQDRSQWIEVLVDYGGTQGLYTYQVPAELTVQPGDILSVPFGAQQVGAIAIQRLSTLPPELASTTIRPVEEIVSRGFSQQTIGLC